MVLYGVKDQVLAIKLFKYKQRYVVMDKVVTMTEVILLANDADKKNILISLHSGPGKSKG